jgi:membrane protease YdiL (CAAX protease family)
VAGYELFVAPMIVFTLRRAGWRWADFHVHPSRQATVQGAALALLVLIPSFLLEKAFDVPQPDLRTSLPAVLAVSIVNPVFEELIVVGFVIEALRKRFGLAVAVNTSIAIRMLYHLYQGPMAFIVFAAIGLVFTFWYVRTGRLWPLIVAHMVLDFIGLASFD